MTRRQIAGLSAFQRASLRAIVAAGYGSIDGGVGRTRRGRVEVAPVYIATPTRTFHARTLGALLRFHLVEVDGARVYPTLAAWCIA